MIAAVFLLVLLSYSAFAAVFLLLLFLLVLLSYSTFGVCYLVVFCYLFARLGVCYLLFPTFCVSSSFSCARLRVTATLRNPKVQTSLFD